MTYDKDTWRKEKQEKGEWLCPELYRLVKKEREQSKEAWIKKQKDDGKWLPKEDYIKLKNEERKRKREDDDEEERKNPKILRPHSDILDVDSIKVIKRELIFDTETTGLGREHKIVEMSLIEVIDGKKTGRNYHCFFNPEMNIPQNAINVHKITNEKIKDAPLFKNKAEEIIKFIDNSVMVAHNANFDMDKLNKELYDAGWEKYNSDRFIDTLKISRHLFPNDKHHKQDNLCEKFNIDNSKRLEDGHSAIEDTILLYHIYNEMIELLKKEDLSPYDFRL